MTFPWIISHHSDWKSLMMFNFHQSYLDPRQMNKMVKTYVFPSLNTSTSSTSHIIQRHDDCMEDQCHSLKGPTYSRPFETILSIFKEVERLCSGQDLPNCQISLVSKNWKCFWPHYRLSRSPKNKIKNMLTEKFRNKHYPKKKGVQQE